ncbi:uncharacterized protein LOC130440696 [Diorhabda sublineata]|uniref:uncharacterized protein LOC130440696 n=1 Tax=Diorhabda sublineata TaxID=1163346 RepID=UPI0024E12427|nr:uncharacterized protein LOC130440696 [Diorhabda sublineata]
MVSVTLCSIILLAVFSCSSSLPTLPFPHQFFDIISKSKDEHSEKSFPENIFDWDILFPMMDKGWQIPFISSPQVQTSSSLPKLNAPKSDSSISDSSNSDSRHSEPRNTDSQNSDQESSSCSEDN